MLNQGNRSNASSAGTIGILAIILMLGMAGVVHSQDSNSVSGVGTPGLGLFLVEDTNATPDDTGTAQIEGNVITLPFDIHSLEFDRNPFVANSDEALPGDVPLDYFEENDGESNSEIIFETNGGNNETASNEIEFPVREVANITIFEGAGRFTNATFAETNVYNKCHYAMREADVNNNGMVESSESSSFVAAYSAIPCRSTAADGVDENVNSLLSAVWPVAGIAVTQNVSQLICDVVSAVSFAECIAPVEKVCPELENGSGTTAVAITSPGVRRLASTSLSTTVQQCTSSALDCVTTQCDVDDSAAVDNCRHFCTNAYHTCLSTACFDAAASMTTGPESSTPELEDNLVSHAVIHATLVWAQWGAWGAVALAMITL